MKFKWAVCGMSLLAVLLPAVSVALPLDTAVERALARDAGLNELAERSRALDHQAVADRSLPDPEVTIGAEGLPINDPFSADMMTMYKIGIRQRFPAGDSRQLSAERSSTLARALDAEAQARMLEVTLQTRLAWLAWVSAHESASVVTAMTDHLEELVALTQRRFAAGTGRLQDETQARLELSLLERRVLDAQTAVDEARARLKRWTGPLQAGGPEYPLPEWSSALAGPSDSDARIARNPQLAAANQRVEAGEIGTDLARQSYRPQWMIEAGYGHQRGSAPMGGRMSDKLFAMATFSLPLFTANRQDRRVDAALAQRDAAEAGLWLTRQRLSGELDQHTAVLARLHERQALLEDSILPQARAVVDATASAYQSDRASFDELIRARLRQLEMELDLINTRERLLATIARIAALTNEEPS